MTEPPPLGFSGRPAYQEMADLLRSQVADGTLRVGQIIPSTARLTARHDVSATVVRAAVRQLQTEGVLLGVPGKGVYVRATPDTVAADTAHVEEVDRRVHQLREDLAGLTLRVDDTPTGDAVAALRTEMEELRRQIAVLQTQVMDLYSRIGRPYPRDAVTSDTR